MDKRFEVTDHTADIGITAYGKDLADLLVNAACGMMTLIVDPQTVNCPKAATIKLTENDSVALLVEWLNTLLYELDANGMIFREFDIAVSGETSLAASCRGERLDRSRHRLKREVKAATYHNLEIGRENGIYSAHIIFDI